MKNRIREQYPLSVIVNSNETLYIADFTERTHATRKVEIHKTCPLAPEQSQNMDCLILNNTHSVSTEHSIFNDHQFKTEEKLDISHCECCVFPTENNEKTWILFIEIKDCKAKNIADYKEKMKEQIISTVAEFRKHKLISDSNKAHGVLSFPRRNKTSFNDFIVGDIIRQTQLYKEYNILFAATNYLSIEDSYRIVAII